MRLRLYMNQIIFILLIAIATYVVVFILQRLMYWLVIIMVDSLCLRPHHFSTLKRLLFIPLANFVKVISQIFAFCLSHATRIPHWHFLFLQIKILRLIVLNFVLIKSRYLILELFFFRGILNFSNDKSSTCCKGCGFQLLFPSSNLLVSLIIEFFFGSLEKD